MSEVYDIVKNYFRENPTKEIRPGTITRYVEEHRKLPPGTQSSGAVRAAINKGFEEGWLEGVSQSPLTYRLIPDKLPSFTDVQSAASIPFSPSVSSVTFTEVAPAGATNSQSYKAALLEHLHTDPSHARNGSKIYSSTGIMALETEHSRQHGHLELERLRLRKQADPEGR